VSQDPRKLVRPIRLSNGLYKFKEDTNIDRVVLACITNLQNGADLLWIETPTPNVQQIAAMVNRLKEVAPNARLVYKNSHSFYWTLNFRSQVFDEMLAEGKNMTAYNRNNLLDVHYDGSRLCHRVNQKIKTFQIYGTRKAGIFHHLIALPTDHTTVLHMNDLTEGYFGEEGMLAYVKGAQRQEIRKKLLV
jgi:isocitrate lyase